ncbi:hypothetical protein HYV70_03720 [Candidatus Uhrbacteria bacterium]|nr:hypothetical protein [Candidatus Uhrbacteria bacterium]
MTINFLRPAHVCVKTKCSFLLLGLFLGVSSHIVWTNQRIVPSPRTKTEVKSPVYYPVVNVVPTDFCDASAVHKTICDSSKIDPRLKAKIIGASNAEDFFPKKLRVMVKEDFKPGSDFPTNRYPHSSTMYGVTLSSLDELAALSEIEGIKSIDEFETVELN